MASRRPPASRMWGRVSNSETKRRDPASSPGRQAVDPATVTGRAGARFRPGSAGCSRPLRGTEAGLEVGEDVVEGLDADAEPHQVRGDPGGELLVGLELRVGRRCGMDGEAAHVTDVGEVAEQLEAFDEPSTRFE